MLSIGKLAAQTGVKVPTIRYYEEIGLLEEPGRNAGNQRRYDRQSLERLAFIRHARDLGFALEDIRQMIEMSAHPSRPCDTLDQIALRQLAATRAKIARLQRLEAELARIAEGCAHGVVGECSVLAALGDHSQCASDHRVSEEEQHRQNKGPVGQ